MSGRSYIQGTLENYIKELSEKSIVPGGGSAAALTASLGTGLVLMVINFSLGKNDNDKQEKSLLDYKQSLEKSLDRLKRLVDEDCKVFKELMDLLSSKKEAQDGYKNAAWAPMGVCYECKDSFFVLSSLADMCNKNLVSDIGCSSQLLAAAFHSARLNVEINLSNIKDNTFVEDLRTKLNNLKNSVDKENAEILVKVESIMNLENPNG